MEFRALPDLSDLCDLSDLSGVRKGGRCPAAAVVLIYYCSEYNNGDPAFYYSVH